MWGHSRSLAQLRAQQLLVNGAAQLLWVSNPRWVQLLLLKYSFSSGFKSNGELRYWEGGKFPNKQTLRGGLSRARQWKEPDSKVPCKRGGCYALHPIGTRTWPQGSWGHGGWVCCIPNQFSSHIGVTVSSGWMTCKDQQQGQTVQGQTRHPGTQGCGQSSWGRATGCHVRLLIVSREALNMSWEHPRDP